MKAPCKSGMLVGAFVLVLLLRDTWARSWRDVDNTINIARQGRISATEFEINPFVQYESDSSAPEEEEEFVVVPGSPSIPGREDAPSSSREPFKPYTPVEEDPSLPDPIRFPENPVPQNPPRGYFNYDTREGSLYGPGFPSLVRDEDGLSVQYRNNGWGYVQNPILDFYWKEFSNFGSGAWNGALASRNFYHNQCANTGRQSPIDVRASGVACVEHHQIRTLPGDYRMGSYNVKKLIEPNKLRLVFNRRPCPDFLNPLCQEPDPPHADFPNGWGGFADALHVDFKIPAEHRMYGHTFDAEMQIFHLHPGRQRLPAISVLMRVDPKWHNAYLQQAIDAFQYESDRDRGKCGEKIRRSRRLISDFHNTILGNTLSSKIATDYESWAEFSTNLDDPQFDEKGREFQRLLNSGIWDPYHPALIPTYWFFGYDGSLTEPPCTEIVSWFVMDTPMRISPEQLDQMKRILFGHIDSSCRKTSAHFHDSVARPIQESAGRQVFRCTRDDFLPDFETNN